MTSSKTSSPSSKTPSITLATRNQNITHFPGRWVYFGRDYLDMCRWEKKLGKTSRISFGQWMQPTFMKLRQEFIEWTSKLGQPYGDSLEWWITPLASRNTSMTPLFVHICYIDILFEHLLNETEGELLIVCEDWFLLSALEQNLRAKQIPIRFAGSRALQKSRTLVKEKIYGILRWGNALRVNLGLLFAARSTKQYAPSNKSDATTSHTIIHTCIDEACFGSDGEFKDRFFGDLSQWLQTRDLSALTIPWLFNVKRPVKSAMRWFRENRQPFLILEDHIRLSDFPRCMRQIRKSARILKKGQHQFDSYDVTPLIERERLRNGSSAYNLKFLLYMAGLRRWKQTGKGCERFIDLFENVAPERPPIRAMNELFPDALTIGYQHSIAPLDLIGYAMTRSEWDTGVFPKRIVTHGKASAKFLENQGYPAAQIKVGPAFRYTYLLERNSEIKDESAKGDTSSVLVLLTLDPEPAAETISAVLNVKSILDSFGLSVAMKAHPMMAGDRLEREVMEGPLPSGWRWVKGGMREHLQQSRLVIGLGTGGLMEAAAFGVPVICLGREMDLAYNPLETFGEVYDLCKTVAPSELGEQLQQILNTNDLERRYQLSKLSSEIIDGMGALDEDHYGAFL